MAWHQRGINPLSEPEMTQFTDAYIGGSEQDCSNSIASALE